MNCPICGYVMDPLAKDCPKCVAKQGRHEATSLPPQSAPQEKPFEVTDEVGGLLANSPTRQSLPPLPTPDRGSSQTTHMPPNASQGDRLLLLILSALMPIVGVILGLVQLVFFRNTTKALYCFAGAALTPAAFFLMAFVLGRL